MCAGRTDSEGPDPGLEGAKFLAWLKRNGAAKNLTTCLKKMRHLGLEPDESIRAWESDRICEASSRGDKVIWLRDLSWADDWARVYGIEVPHHAQFIDTKEKLR